MEERSFAREAYIYTSHISEPEAEQHEEAMSALFQVETRTLVKLWKADVGKSSSKHAILHLETSMGASYKYLDGGVRTFHLPESERLRETPTRSER